MKKIQNFMDNRLTHVKIWQNSLKVNLKIAYPITIMIYLIARQKVMTRTHFWMDNI